MIKHDEYESTVFLYSPFHLHRPNSGDNKEPHYSGDLELHFRTAASSFSITQCNKDTFNRKISPLNWDILRMWTTG